MDPEDRDGTEQAIRLASPRCWAGILRRSVSGWVGARPTGVSACCPGTRVRLPASDFWPIGEECRQIHLLATDVQPRVGPCRGLQVSAAQPTDSCYAHREVPDLTMA